jgi:MoxR-like ATPase
VASGDDVLALSAAARGVHVSEAVETYILALTRATREEAALALGASPRGSLALYHTAQALAALRGRAFVLPDDVQALAGPVLEHRLIPSSQSRLRGKALADILKDVVAKVPVPVEESWSESGG